MSMLWMQNFESVSNIQFWFKYWQIASQKGKVYSICAKLLLYYSIHTCLLIFTFIINFSICILHTYFPLAFQGFISFLVDYLSLNKTKSKPNRALIFHLVIKKAPNIKDHKDRNIKSHVKLKSFRIIITKNVTAFI